jgi:hypothetical protein
MSKRFTPERIAIFQSTDVAPARHRDYCNMVIAMYQEIVAMRPADAGYAEELPSDTLSLYPR